MNPGKINTLIISANFFPIEGGIQTYMYQLAKYWECGDSSVLCFREKDEPLSQNKPFCIKRIPKLRVPYTRGIIEIVSFLIKAKKTSLLFKFLFFLLINRDLSKSIGRMLSQSSIFFDSSSPDQWVIQCSRPVLMGVVGLAVKIRFGHPYVVYIHGSELLTQSKRFNRKKLFGLVMSHADLVIANSNYTRSEANKICRITDIKVINLGAELDVFYPEKKKMTIMQKYKIAPNSKILLTIGHLVPRKGHDNVIRSLPEILDKHPEVYYLIVGQGPDKDRLTKIAKELKVLSNVRFCGFIPNEELRDYFNVCDIFVMPNREEHRDVEGFGIVFLEANACKKPVIGGNSGGVPDAIEDGKTGFLVDPYNIVDIKDKLMFLIENPDIANEMGENGFKKVIEKSNWQSVCQSINKLIFQCLNAKSSS